MDDTYKRLMNNMFGKQRGQLYRSERDWYAFGSKNTKQKLTEVRDHNKERVSNLKNTKGFSSTKQFMYLGMIPLEIVIANPELWFDDKASERFFKDNPQFSSKGV